MSIWSHISAVGDSIGSFLSGLTSGHSAPEKSVGFTIGMIALGAKMARADGVVTKDEIKAFSEVFRVPDTDRPALQRVFDLAKGDIAGFETYAKQIAKLFKQKSTVLENVLDGLFHIAKADGAVHEDELIYLEEVARIFGFTSSDFFRIQSRHVVHAIEDPYQILGVDRTSTAAELKAHHRKLVRENHPDKQIAAGVPVEMVSLATERLARINAAYDEIQKERGA